MVLTSEKRPSLAGDREEDAVKLTMLGPETGRKIGTPILGLSSASVALSRVGAD